MKLGKIEKNIPIPPMDGKYSKPINKKLDKIKVGDSFTITCEFDDKISVRGLGFRISNVLKRYPEKKFTMSKESIYRYRVWRIK